MEEDKSLDFAGIGKLAKAIPEKVYEQTSEVINSTFSNLISPITETTAGLGRYIRQKFDNMVEVEKALLTYSVQNALKKAKSNRLLMKPEQRPKELITIMDALSKETDPLLNTLWTNLLCSELTNQNSHPFFISILQSLSRKDAEILSRLHDYDATGEKKSNILISRPYIQYWVTENGAKPEEWSFSCSFLCEMGLASTVTPEQSENHGAVILYRTDVGRSFLEAVTS